MAGAIQCVRVDQDAEGLRLAVRELFEESFAHESVRPVLELLGDNEHERERVMASLPERTLSPGYYDRSAYLLELGSAIEAGAHYTAATLARVDVLGLEAVRRAKSQFEYDHPSCSACGTRQENRFAAQCRSCRVKFIRGDN